MPLGSAGPDAFTTDARDLHFEQSASYTQQLQKLVPAPSDEHWVGYISDVRTFATGKAAEEPTGIHAAEPSFEDLRFGRRGTARARRAGAAF